MVSDNTLNALMAASELSIPRQGASRRYLGGYASACRCRMMHESPHLRKRYSSVHFGEDLVKEGPS